MEIWRTFRYVGGVVRKEWRLEDELHETVQEGRTVSVHEAVMRNRDVSMEVKKLLHDNTVSPTLTYGRETWMLLERLNQE